jgi:hypothetical protein
MPRNDKRSSSRRSIRARILYGIRYLLEAVDKLAPTIVAEMMLFAVMDVTVLLVFERLAAPDGPLG